MFNVNKILWDTFMLQGTIVFCRFYECNKYVFLRFMLKETEVQFQREKSLSLQWFDIYLSRAFFNQACLKISSIVCTLLWIIKVSLNKHIIYFKYIQITEISIRGTRKNQFQQIIQNYKRTDYMFYSYLPFVHLNLLFSFWYTTL